MLPILTTVFEMNEDGPEGALDQPVDFLLGPGAFSAFADVVAYVPGVRSLQLLRPGETAPLAPIEGVRAMLTAVKAEHRDLTGRSDAAIGLRIELQAQDEFCRIGVTGDTRYVEAAAQAFVDVDMMVVHIGSVYDSDRGAGDVKSWHLGFEGAANLLAAIKKGSKRGWNPLVLVSEWGEELAPHRTVICEELVKSAGIDRVFPAEWKQSVALSGGRADPMCAREDGEIADHWYVHPAEEIEYLCRKHDHPRGRDVGT